MSLAGCDHGTHVAGIAAGQTSPLGFDGVARVANTIAVQVFSRLHDSTGNTPCANAERSSPYALSFTSDQMQALEHVYNLRNTLNIAAVNMSLGGGKHTSACDSDALKPIIDNLPAAGIATVIAAGNKGYTDAIGAPACISTAISVGATSQTDVVASFSNSAAMLSLHT